MDRPVFLLASPLGKRRRILEMPVAGNEGTRSARGICRAPENGQTGICKLAGYLIPFCTSFDPENTDGLTPSPHKRFYF
jgi:hypothetical protein